MNTDPLTEAEIARVPASLKTQAAIDTITCYYHASQDEIVKLQRELLATREKLQAARDAIEHVLNGGKGREVFPPSDEWHGESFAIVSAALTQLNQP